MNLCQEILKIQQPQAQFKSRPDRKDQRMTQKTLGVSNIQRELNLIWILQGSFKLVQIWVQQKKNALKSMDLDFMINFIRAKQDFIQKGLADDLVDLRFKHFQSRLIDTLNRVLQERRDIKMRQVQKEMVELKIKAGLNQSESQEVQYPKQTIVKSQSVAILPLNDPKTRGSDIAPGKSIFQTEVGIIDQRQQMNTSHQSGFIKPQAQKLTMPSIKLPQTSQNYNLQSQAKTARTASNFLPRQGNNSQIKDIKMLISKTAFKEAMQQQQQQLGNNSNNHTDILGLSGLNRNQSVTTLGIKTHRASTQNPLLQQILLTDEQRLQRQKMLKIQNLARKIEIQEEGKKKLEDIEKKIKKCQKKQQQRIQELQEIKKHKNLQKHLEVQNRAQSLSKLFEDSIQRENERQLQNMSVIMKNQMELEEKKRQEIARKEREYQEKREQVQDFRQERENLLNQELDLQMQSLEMRLNRSQQVYQQNIQRIVSEARIKNDQVLQKQQIQRQQQQEYEQMEKEALKIYHKQLKKKLRSKKYLLNQHLSPIVSHQKLQSKQTLPQPGSSPNLLALKSKHSEQEQRRLQEQQEERERLEQMERKLKEAENIKKQLQEQKEREFVLNNELRKLREDDIKKLRERQKRLENQKKVKIMQKEQEHIQYIQQVKQSEQMLQKLKLQNSLKKMKDAQELEKTLIQVHTKGKVLTPQTIQLMEKEGLPIPQNLKKINEDDFPMNTNL